MGVTGLVHKGAVAMTETNVQYFWDTTDSPLGDLLLISTSEGLYQLAFPNEDFEAILQNLGDVSGLVPQRSSRNLKDASAQLEEYFAGDRSKLTLPLDEGEVPPFRSRVLAELALVPYGETVTYAELAERAGSPHAARAVGSACSNNRLPLIVPCHRVVRSDHSAGGYRGGSPAKAFLLELEAEHSAG